MEHSVANPAPSNASAPSKLAPALAWFSFAAALIMVLFWYLDMRDIRTVLIYTIAIAYLATAFAAGAHRSNFGRLILVGILCAAFADVYGPINFEAGAIAFLIGHFFYVGAFFIHGISWKHAIAGLIGYGIASAALMAYVFPKVPGDQQVLIGVYTGVLAVMGGFAVGTLGRGATWCMAVAGVLFYISDYFLAATMFLDGGFINSALGYPMYYAAIILFAITPRYDTPQKQES